MVDDMNLSIEKELFKALIQRLEISIKNIEEYEELFPKSVINKNKDMLAIAQDAYEKATPFPEIRQTGKVRVTIPRCRKIFDDSASRIFVQSVEDGEKVLSILEELFPELTPPENIIAVMNDVENKLIHVESYPIDATQLYTEARRRRIYIALFSYHNRNYKSVEMALDRILGTWMTPNWEHSKIRDY